MRPTTASFANAPMVVSFHAMVLFLGAKIGQASTCG